MRAAPLRADERSPRAPRAGGRTGLRKRGPGGRGRLSHRVPCAAPPRAEAGWPGGPAGCLPLGRARPTLPVARGPRGAALPVCRGACHGLAGVLRPRALPVAPRAVLLARLNAPVAGDAQAPSAAGRRRPGRRPQRRDRPGAVDDVLQRLVPVPALAALPEGPRIRLHPGPLHPAPRIRGLHGLLERLPAEDRRVVRAVLEPQHRHGQSPVVRLGSGAPRGAAVLPLPDADPRRGDRLPGDDGPDECGPRARRLLERDLPRSRRLPLPLQPPQRLLAAGPAMRPQRPGVRVGPPDLHGLQRPARRGS
mmetsp:Transcript_108314/g.323920  ORF Transcript_108314/g.323920 Transcript_108314/m.323920 type:complete len:307 (-) Transcript_108314:299-1219(-)